MYTELRKHIYFGLFSLTFPCVTCLLSSGCGHFDLFCAYVLFLLHWRRDFFRVAKIIVCIQYTSYFVHYIVEFFYIFLSNLLAYLFNSNWSYEFYIILVINIYYNVNLFIIFFNIWITLKNVLISIVVF